MPYVGGDNGRTASPTPSSSSHCTPTDETTCVEIGWSLGSFAASSRRTFCPARARGTASDAPAHRAPTTIVSKASAGMGTPGAGDGPNLLAQERNDEGGAALGLVDERPMATVLEDVHLGLAEVLALLLSVADREEDVAGSPEDQRRELERKEPVAERAAHSVEVRGRPVQLEDGALRSPVQVIEHA